MSKMTKKRKTNLKRFFILFRSYMIASYIIVLYGLMILYYFIYSDMLDNHIIKEIPNSPTVMLVLYTASAVFNLVFYLFVYHMEKDMLNGLCYQVIEKCAERDQYKRFEEIKRCIETFRNDRDECDVKKNMNVLSSALAYDDAKSIAYPIIASVVKLAAPNDGVGWFFGGILIVTFCFFAYRLSRNAFIKKVIECIRDEREDINSIIIKR